MQRCDPTVNIVKWQQVIDRLSRDAGKYRLLEIEGIDILSGEMALIDSLQSRSARRLLFVMIAAARYGNTVNPNNRSWVNRQDRELFRLANIQLPVRRQSFLIHDMRNLGLIGYSRIVDNINMQVRCMGGCEPAEGGTEVEAAVKPSPKTTRAGKCA